MTLSASHNDFFSRIAFYVRRFSAWLARAGFGFFVVVAAGAALLATTFIGLLIAVAALLLNLASRVTSGSRNDAGFDQDGFYQSSNSHVFEGRSKKSASKKSANTETLEAHKTANGWVIEPDA